MAAARRNTLSSVPGFAGIHSSITPSWLTRAHSSGFQWGVQIGQTPPPPHMFFSSSSTSRRNRPRIIIYYARLADHQRPSRRGLRIAASPGHGYVRGPGFPTPLFTPVTPNLRSPDRPQFRMASILPGAGGCVRRRACLRTPPPLPGGMFALK